MTFIGLLSIFHVFFQEALKKTCILKEIISPHDIPSGGKSATNTSPLGLPATVPPPTDGADGSTTTAPDGADGSAPAAPPAAAPEPPAAAQDGADGPVPAAPAPVSTAEPCWVDSPNQLAPVTAVEEDPEAPTSPEGEESRPTYVVHPQAIAGVLALLRGWGCEG